MSNNSEPSVTKVDSVTIITLGSRFENIDEIIIDELRDFVLEASAAADPPKVLIDLSQTTFFGSSFIELLFRVWNRMNSLEGGRFVISGLTTYCQEVLEVTHLDQLWNIFPTKEEALASFKSA